MIEEVDGDGPFEVLAFEVGESGELGSSFDFELAEAILDSSEDTAIRVVLGFKGTDETILAIADVIEGSTKSVKLGGSIGLGFTVNGAKVDGEQRASVGTEDPLGEELGDSSEEVDTCRDFRHGG